MLCSMPAGLSAIILLAATASSQSARSLPPCWQQCALKAASTGPQCSQSELESLCQPASTNLEDLLSSMHETCDDLQPHNFYFALRDLQRACTNTQYTISDADLECATNTEHEGACGQLETELKARGDPEKQALVKRNIQSLISSDAVTASPPTLLAATATKAPTSVIPNSVLIGNDNMATESLIPTYTGTPPLVISDGTSAAPSHEATGSSSSDSSNGGTLLDMSGAASGRGTMSLLGLTGCVLACAAWF